VELGTLVDVDDPVGGRFAVPDGIVQEALDSVQDYLNITNFFFYFFN
jgi:hypothetical protein